VAEIEADSEVEMNGSREANTIKIDGKRDKGKKVLVHHGAILAKWRAWNYEDFLRKWSRTYLTISLKEI
jgi:hypothetical protein